MESRSEQEQKRRENEPMYWFNKSSDLHAAAGAIWYARQHSAELAMHQELGLGESFNIPLATWPVYLMLCGLSLELVYKAVVVARGEKPSVSHDLCKLAKAARIELPDDDKGLLNILTECIYWYSKYPAPLSAHHAALDRLSLLFTNHLSEATPGTSMKIRRPKAPNPMRWEAFTSLWADGSHAFADAVRMPSFLRE